MDGLQPPKCPCIATNHPLHKPGHCDEPASPQGGGYAICLTCRYAKSPKKEPK
jgi:hypothetical protein